jgi:hypothetical protein
MHFINCQAKREVLSTRHYLGDEIKEYGMTGTFKTPEGNQK